PGRPFDNTYWLRNPNFKAEFLIRYEGNDEVEILSDKVEKVSMLRAAYLEVDEVQQHFRDAPVVEPEGLVERLGGVTEV
ncbi:virulence factor SrfC family protein, partial [Rhizobium leguminosarum]|uniref:virulence factor SrfC family protein n=1 Tax=Rhizobium leguminosarum TaxID=384 RepID=UPI003F975943